MNHTCAVIMSIYNPNEYFKEQLLSILNQSINNITIYIRDDGSDEKIYLSIKKTCDKFSNIKLFRGENVGYSESFYLALCNAFQGNYDYYAYADQDDIWAENKLSLLIETLNQNNFSDLIFSNGIVIDKYKHSLGLIYNKSYKFNNFLDCISATTYGMTFLFTKKLASILVKTGSIPFKKYAHDDWTCIVASVTGNVTYLNQNLVYYRQHENNVSGFKINKQSTFLEKIIKLFNINVFLKQWEFKISTLAKEICKYVDINNITDDEIKFIAKNEKNSYKKLIFNSEFRSNSIYLDLIIRILICIKKL
ncbi:MAG: glycosyltransferase [Lactobacillus sp.]|nr:glycosyltransferase [Lactobacillus sp.]